MTIVFFALGSLAVVPLLKLALPKVAALATPKVVAGISTLTTLLLAARGVRKKHLFPLYIMENGKLHSGIYPSREAAMRVATGFKLASQEK